MPWNNNGPSPWGAPPSGGGRRPDGGRGPWGPGGPANLPDPSQLLNALRGWLGRFGGGGGGGGGGRGGKGGLGAGGTGKMVAVAVGAVILLWLASGLYRVQPDQQGVVLRFGAFVRTAGPGLNYHLPWPIETVLRPAVTRINRIEIGYRSAQSAQPGSNGTPSIRDLPEESLMLTGDENIIDINFAVFWQIRNAPDFLFNTRHPQQSVKAVAESVMREVIGSTPLEPALTEARARIETAVMKGTQAILNQYGAGVEITEVQLQRVDPPSEVIESFRDVQRAVTDAERLQNEADAYANNVVPVARGTAAQIVAAAQAERTARIAEATGQAKRFLSVLHAYQLAKDVTVKRLYIETMQHVMDRLPTTVVDDRMKGLLPFLPLTGPVQSQTAPLGTAAPAASASPAAPSASTTGGQQ